MKTIIRICLIIALLTVSSIMTEKQILMTILSGVVCMYWDIIDKEK